MILGSINDKSPTISPQKIFPIEGQNNIQPISMIRPMVGISMPPRVLSATSYNIDTSKSAPSIVPKPLNNLSPLPPQATASINPVPSASVTSSSGPHATRLSSAVCPPAGMSYSLKPLQPKSVSSHKNLNNP